MIFGCRFFQCFPAVMIMGVAMAVSSEASAQQRREMVPGLQAELREPAQARSPDPFTPRPRRTTIEGTGDEKAIEVSVLTEDQALELFRRVRGMRELALNRPWNGCMARSQIISQRVEEIYGVATGQVWVRKGNAVASWRGSFDVQMPGEKERVGVPWNLHVAPFVLVEKNGRNEVWMLDPVLDKERPLPQENGEGRPSEKPRRNTIYTTSRFAYRPK
jgi:hypothetical protein